MNTEQEVKRLLERVKGFMPIHLDDCDLSLHEQAVKKLYALVQAQQEELEALRRKEVFESVVHDLHDALDVRYGDNVYHAIEELRRDAERYRFMRRNLLVIDLNGGEPSGVDERRFDKAVQDAMTIAQEKAG